MSLDTDQGRLRKGSFSFPEVTLHQLETLAAQRKTERDTDYQKRALKIGTLFITIEEGPDRATGRYGEWEEEDFAETLRNWVLLGSDWLERHGHPVSNTGSPSGALSSLLGAMASNMSGPNQQGTTPATLQQGPLQEEVEETPVEAMIGENILSSLNLGDTPML